MVDFIQTCSDFFDTILFFLQSIVDGIGSFGIALSNIFVGLSNSIFIFPSFFGGIMISSFSLLVLLRLIGR